MKHTYPTSLKAAIGARWKSSIKIIASFIFIIVTSFQEISAQNTVSTLCGSSQQGNPLFGPAGLSITQNNSDVYLADYSSHTILRIDPVTGATTILAGNGSQGLTDGPAASAQFYFPSGLCLSSDESTLFVADNANCLIRKINLNTQTVTTIAGVAGAYAYQDDANGLLAKFNQPLDLVLADGDSVMYISDSENHLIRKLNLNSSEVTTVAGNGSAGSGDGAALAAGFRNPSGLALSEDGNKLYIADAGNHLIRVLDFYLNTITTLAGTAGSTGSVDNAAGLSSSFNVPSGVSLAQNDSVLYVMDTFNNLIRKIEISSTSVSTIAGSVSTTSNHFSDGPGLSSKFWHPVTGRISVDGSKLFISDQENFRVRVMETDMITTGVVAISQNEEYNLFPNPANTTVQVNNHSNDIKSISILTASGKIVFSDSDNNKNDITIPIHNLSPGFYFLSIEKYNGGQIFKKFFKNDI